MTDERMDALIRRLDVHVDPDPTFVELALGVVAPRARLARERDRRAVWRLWATLWPPDPSSARGRSVTMRLALTVATVVLLLITIVVAAVLVGGLRRSTFGANGPLVVAHDGEVLVVNAETSEAQLLFHETDPVSGLTRSPDGRLIAYWTGPGTLTRFEVANVDGSDRKRLASSLGVLHGGCIEAWAPDSTSIASSVQGGGHSRIIVADVASGAARFLTPPSVEAECPLWSPDGRSIAFEHDVTDEYSMLAVIDRDGTGMRDLSSDLAGLTDYGTNGWSPDGSFVYFGAGDAGTSAIYRSNVEMATSQRLTGVEIRPFAPMVSPDGSYVSFIVQGTEGWDVHVMRSDGSGEHPLLVNATNSGWSADGKYVLAQWHQPSAGAPNGGLTLITPDGAERRVVLPFDWACATNPDTQVPECLTGAAWGEPTP